jgi:hypothetical protein
MDYPRHYLSLIERARNRPQSIGYVEFHHVIPKCLGGTNESTNIVELTPEEHYIAHLLLAKIYPKNKGINSAAMFMTSKNKNHKRSNKQYAWVKRNLSEIMKGPDNPSKKNPIRGEKHYLFGKKRENVFTDDSKKRISESKKGSKNPFFGCKPWNHPRATDETIAVWKSADVIAAMLGDIGYYRIAKQLGFRPHQVSSVCDYLKSGWVPSEDPVWNKLKAT